jgi:competence protein ComFC
MLKLLKNLGSDILNIILPATCISCGKILSDGRVIVCEPCYSDLEKITPAQIEVFINRVDNREFDNIYIMYEFSKLFQKLMYFFKYEGYQHIAKYFAMSIFEYINNEYDCVSFVPLHKTKQRERGFNQSEVIADYYCQKSKLPFCNHLLKRTKYTQSQTKLGRQQRRENIHKAFSVESDVENKSILLIDDVITTGATLNECAAVLKAANCKKVDIVAIATPVNLLQSKLETHEMDNSVLI